MLWGCISFKGPWEIAVITLTIKVFVYIEFLDNSIDKNWFDDNEIIFQGDSAFCHKAKEIQFFFFFQEKIIKSITWSANSPDQNPSENLWWKFF